MKSREYYKNLVILKKMGLNLKLQPPKKNHWTISFNYWLTFILHWLFKTSKLLFKTNIAYFEIAKSKYRNWYSSFIGDNFSYWFITILIPIFQNSTNVWQLRYIRNYTIIQAYLTVLPSIMPCKSKLALKLSGRFSGWCA